MSYSIQQRIKFEDKFFKDGVPGNMIQLIDGVEKVAADSFTAGYKACKHLEPMVSEEWSNNAALGYAIAAMEYMGLNEEEIRRMVGNLKHAFDMKTIGEASQIYEKSVY